MDFIKEKENIIAEAQQFIGCKINHKTFGDGEIKSITISCQLLPVINFNGTEKTIAVGKVKHLITMENAEILFDILDRYAEVHKQESEAEDYARLKKYMAEKAAKEQAEQEAAYQKKIAVKIKEAESLATTSQPVDSIDWIRENVSAITARVPTYLENWFYKRFGKDAKCSVVDPRQKTSGGYSMIWGLNLAIRFKTTEGMPAELQRLAMPSNPKAIANNQLVFDLCSNYDFKFGSRKDWAAS